MFLYQNEFKTKQDLGVNLWDSSQIVEKKKEKKDFIQWINIKVLNVYFVLLLKNMFAYLYTLSIHVALVFWEFCELELNFPARAKDHIIVYWFILAYPG